MESDHLKNISRGLLAVMLTMALVGCAWSGPHLIHNWAVETQFDSYQIYPGYDYYTSGTLKDPRGVLALKPGYAMDSKGWQPVKMTPQNLERWVQALKKDSFVEYNTFANGARILGRNGVVVGHYYSVWEFPRVYMPDDKTVQINKPWNDYRDTNERWKVLHGGDFDD